MEMKSVSECLNVTDSMILRSIEKHVGIRNLENLLDYMIGMYNEKYLEETDPMLTILSQINLIVEGLCLDTKNDFKNNIEL